MPPILALRTDDVAHETIDGETIVIDLRQQSYYRLEGPAAVAWQGLTQGCEEGTLLAYLQRAYPADAGALAGALPRFLADLGAAGLLTEGETAGLDPLAATPAPAPFTGFALHGFSDLEEILWVDPVHDVDEATGWPTLPPIG